MMKKRNFKRVLITGIVGSGASYLAEYIVHNHPNVEVHGLLRWHSTTDMRNLKTVAGRIHLHECDMTDFSTLFTLIAEVQPDAIFHLASQANVGVSFQTPLSVLNNNIMSTANMYEAVKLSRLDATIQLCSTSEVYGQVDSNKTPMKEDCPLRPSSPYAVSKAAQDLLGWTYYSCYKMKIIRTRMFSYINPRRIDLFATSFARQVARIEAGLQANSLVHGNLESVRTLIDVRDAVEAYWRAAECCVPGEAYNIGGSVAIKVGEFLDLLLGLSKTPIKTRQDAELLRPADVMFQVPNVEKFTKATQWKPKRSLEESTEFLLDHWRKETAAEVQKNNK